MSHDWIENGPRPGDLDLISQFYYSIDRDPFDDSFFNGSQGNPEFAAFWATLTLKQKIVGSLCSIAAGAAGAGVLIALVGFLH